MREAAPTLSPTTPSLPTVVAKLGTGLTLSALSALLIGLLMPMAFVFPLVIFAEPTTLLENVLHAIRVTTSLKEPALSLLPTIVLLLMLDARIGTGTVTLVLNALSSGIPLKDCAYLSLIFAKLSMKLMDNVFRAMLVMTSLKDHASSHPQTQLLLLMPDARFGRVESAKSAQLIGSSTTPESVSQFPMSAAPTMSPAANV